MTSAPTTLAAEDRLSVQALLGRLSEHQRQVVELPLAGLTGTEIAPFEAIESEAAVWRVSAGTVERS